MKYLSALLLGLTLCLPSLAQDVPAYTLAFIDVGEESKNVDVMVIGLRDGSVDFVDAIPTSKLGEWVFTGPPGNYSVRIAKYTEDAGVTVSVRKLRILPPGVLPPSPTDPTDPVPVDPTTPTDNGGGDIGGPPPEGHFNFSGIIYDLLKEKKPDATKSKQVAANFEWAAKAQNVELTALLAELKKRNEAVGDVWLNVIKPTWVARAEELQTQAIMNPTVEDHQWAFAETAAGIRAVYGK